MQVMFTKWSMDGQEEARTAVSVNPKRVDTVESYSPAMPPNRRWEGDPGFPAASKITMMNKQVFIVEGTPGQVACELNSAEDEVE